jgi:hypothetical protein
VQPLGFGVWNRLVGGSVHDQPRRFDFSRRCQDVHLRGPMRFDFVEEIRSEQ